MNADYYGLIEMAFTLVVVLVFGFWQLYSLKRSNAAKPGIAKDKPKISGD